MERAASPTSANWLSDLTGRGFSDRAARAVLHYGGAVGLVALATLLDRHVPALKNENGIPLFFAAILLSAWFGGWGPALVSTVTAAAATTYFFDNAPGAARIGWDDITRSVVFLMVAALISSLTAIRRRAEEALQESHAQLEQRVRQRTAELLQSEERFRILVEGVADYAIVLLDLRGNVVSWNAGAQRIYGYTAGEIIGRPFTRFYADEDAARGEPAAQLGAASLQGRLEDEAWRRRKDASRFWANVILTALTDELGHPRGFAQVTRDITELRQLERQVLEVSEAEQRRFGHDLHDGLGQELTGLAFLAQNLQRQLLTNDHPEEASRAGRIHDLINRALEQTRELAHGFSPVELGPEGLRDALRDLARRAEGLYDLPCTFTMRNDARVDDDSAALHLFRIAQEALTNAMRHGHPSGVRIQLEGEPPPGGTVTLTIADDGIGLPPEAERRPGMGLRAMLYRARVIGASLDVRPNPHGGTVVTCVYQNNAASAAEPVTTGPAPATPSPSNEDPHVPQTDDRRPDDQRQQHDDDRDDHDGNGHPRAVDAPAGDPADRQVPHPAGR